MSPSNRKKYLFIRLLEACNADCFMCEYALSPDRYRFTLAEFRNLLPSARTFGVGFVRFTGGEPLLHREAVELVRAGAETGMKMSLITNGALLPKKIDRLARAGLAQVIVSIDGATAASHDRYRNSPGLFEKDIRGLQMARELGVLTRVNTVVGPHNYDEMPQLQRVLTDTKVQQWELSAVKLGRRIAYPDPERVLAVCEPIYRADRRTTLVPMGKRFYGDTAAERDLFFNSGVTPRAGPPCCNVVGDVIYLDAKSGRGYGCSLLPHRSEQESGGGAMLKIDDNWTFDRPEFRDHLAHFRVAGPSVCSGCSTTAAGYSDEIARWGAVPDWRF